MKPFRKLRFIVLLIFPLMVALGITVYETVDSFGEYGGAWDENIFADDVHFHAGGIITNITMYLAIMGTGQTCRVWIFDQLGKDAVYTADFTK